MNVTAQLFDNDKIFVQFETNFQPPEKSNWMFPSGDLYWGRAMTSFLHNAVRLITRHSC